MAVTIKELSAYCGLSVSTVSKALNGYPDVSEETKEQVHAAAQKLGYRANAIARSLKIGRTFNIGVLYRDQSDSGFTHSYFAPILDAFRDAAERRGYDITFITNSMGRSKMTFLEHCRYRNVDGVCIVCTAFDDPEVRELIESDLPVVTVDDAFPGRVCVQSENEAGVAALVRHAISLGHKRIAFIRGEETSVTRIRLDVARRTLAEAGLTLPDSYIVEGKYHHPAAAREATMRLLALDPRPTCIMMTDDYAALGGLEAAQALGLHVPEDISIAGYDGVPLIQLCKPRLTTIWQDTTTIGQEAARQLVRLIEHPGDVKPGVIPVPCRLIRGDSMQRVAAPDSE